jgi:hypothetical protein
VYGEDEYLSADGTHASEGPSPPADDEGGSVLSVGERSHNSRSGRLLGIGLLVGVAAGAVGLVVVNASHRYAAPHSVGTRPAPSSASSQPPRKVFADTGPTVHTQTFTAPNLRAHIPVRPPALPLPRSHVMRVTQPMSIARPREIQPPTAKLSGSDGEAIPIDFEFDFEH